MSCDQRGFFGSADEVERRLDLALDLALGFADRHFRFFLIP